MIFTCKMRVSEFSDSIKQKVLQMKKNWYNIT